LAIFGVAKVMSITIFYFILFHTNSTQKDRISMTFAYYSVENIKMNFKVHHSNEIPSIKLCILQLDSFHPEELSQ